MTYDENVTAIRRALALGLDVEMDPAMADIVPSLSTGQIYWIASWLASEGIGKVSR